MRFPLLLLITPIAVAACNGDSIGGPAAPTGPMMTANTVAAAPDVTTSPFLLEFDDFNPCTGLVEHFVFEGTRRIETFGAHTVVHISGTVTTSDGWVGTFNRQLVFQGDDATLRFFDMEVGPTAARQLFTGVIHVTVVNGQVVTEFQKGTLRCVGKPIA